MKKSTLTAYEKITHKDGLNIWYEKDSEEVVCMVSLTEERGQVWICSLYVAQKHRGNGICVALLDWATFNGGDHISARKGSRAEEIYRSYGFTVYDEDETFSYMKISTRMDEVN